MFFNYKYAGLFVLFGIALSATYTGAVAIKIRQLEIPVGAGVELRGSPAVAVGWGLLGIGGAALLAIAWLLFGTG